MESLTRVQKNSGRTVNFKSQRSHFTSKITLEVAEVKGLVMNAFKHIRFPAKLLLFDHLQISVLRFEHAQECERGQGAAHIRRQDTTRARPRPKSQPHGAVLPFLRRIGRARPARTIQRCPKVPYRPGKRRLSTKTRDLCYDVSTGKEYGGNMCSGLLI